MIRIKMLMAFVAEFMSCVKSLPVSCSWQLAKSKAILCGRRQRFDQAKKEGARAFIRGAQISDNPYRDIDLDLGVAWFQGHLHEAEQWKWQRED